MIFDPIFDEVKEHFFRNDFARAIDQLKDKSEISKAHDLSSSFAYQNKICEFHFLNGNYNEAHRQSAELLRQLEATPVEEVSNHAFQKNWIFQNHATAQYYLGKYQKSIELASKSLENIGANDVNLEKRFKANGNIILGKSHLKKSDLYQARLFFYQALDLYLDIFDKHHIAVGRTFDYLGLANLMAKEVKTAEQFFQKSIYIFNRSQLEQQHVYLGLSCNNMAYCNYTKAQVLPTNQNNYLKEAKNYYTKAERIFQQLPQSAAYQAAVYRGRGDLHKFEKQYQDSLHYYNLEHQCRKTALQRETHPNISRLLNSKSEIYYQQQAIDQAIQNAHAAIVANVDGFDDAINVHKNPNTNLNDIDSPTELIKALENKAKGFKRQYEIDKSLPTLKNAVGCLTKAVRLIINISQTFSHHRSKLELTEQVRPIQELALTYFYDFFKESKLEKDTPERQQLYNDFFKVLQKSKATLLMESIIRKNTPGFHSGNGSVVNGNGYNGSQEAITLQHARAIDQKILDGQDFKEMLTKFNGSPNNIQNAQVSKQLSYLQREISIEQLQAEMKEAHTAVISYFAGRENLYSIIITKNDFEVKNLSEASDFSMQRLKSEVNVFKSLLNKSTNDYYDLDAYAAEANINVETRGTPTLVFNAFTQFQYITTAHYLYESLIEPLALDSTTNRIYIIPDEYLSFIPFEALLCSQHVRTSENGGTTNPNAPIKNYADLDYLIHRYNIGYFFSSATLHYIHNGEKSKVPMRQLSYLGVAANVAIDEYKESAKDFLFEKEVKMVHDLFNCDKKMYTGAAVDKAKILKDFEQYKILHIACHGSDTACLTIIENGYTNSTREVIRPIDMQEIKTKAELIILSACYSGIGPLAHGEGVIALNRSFIHSNGKNIIYTLFGVPANSSYELIEAFAKKIILGVPYSSALWEAKKEFLTKKKNFTPKSWAGYVFMGSHESSIIVSRNQKNKGYVSASPRTSSLT